MKFFNTWLIISLGICMPLSSQSLLNWPLSTSQLGTPTLVVNEISGVPFERGNGIGILNYTGSGVSTNSWASANNDEAQVDFYEFGLSADPEQTIEINELSFGERRSSNGPRNFTLFYSLDGFATKILVKTIDLPDNIFNRNHDIPLDIKIADGQELLFRLFAYNSESPNGSWTIMKNTLSVQGSAMASCSPPANAATINMINTGTNSFQAEITGGNGQGRLIVVGPEQYDFPNPYQGETYTGSSTYGHGDPIAENVHVIKSTTSNTSTITVDGLDEGGFYQIAVFEYNLAEMCYSNEPTIIDIMTSCGTTPRPVQDVRFVSLDKRVAVDWKGPNCFDSYLLVASEQPITGAPVGTNFDDDNEFGEGTVANGFSPGVYPIFYAGNYDEVMVEGLTNDKPYYFALYTRINGQWSSASRFESTPEEGCHRQYFERIFINELHYVNSIVSQDQGVEIAGPSGIDLSNYELSLKVATGGFNNFYYEIHRCQLSGIIDDEGTGLGAIWFPMPNMPQEKGAVILINSVTGVEVDYVEYNPSLGLTDAFSAPSGGGSVFNPHIGNSNLSETPQDTPGYSLQRTGEGNCPIDYTWYKLPHSRGILNLGQQILPVVLTQLAAEAKGEAARVYWQTAAEENSDYFIIEHSTDGRSFNQLGKVKASGSSQVFIDYQFMDYYPAKGINYYRLKQQDFDGTIHNHGVVSVNFDGDGNESLLVYPNPVDQQATISWEGKAETLKLSDGHGRLLRTIVLDEYQDGGSRSMDLGNLPQGAYFLRLEGRDRIETFTVVKG